MRNLIKFGFIIIIILLVQHNRSKSNEIVEKIYDYVNDVKSSEIPVIVKNRGNLDTLRDLEKQETIQYIDSIIKWTLRNSDGYILKDLIEIVHVKSQSKIDSSIFIISSSFLHDSRLSPTLIILNYWKDSLSIFYVSAKDSPKYLFQASNTLSSMINMFLNRLESNANLESPNNLLELICMAKVTHQTKKMIIAGSANFYEQKLSLNQEFEEIYKEIGQIVTFLRCNSE